MPEVGVERKSEKCTAADADNQKRTNPNESRVYQQQPEDARFLCSSFMRYEMPNDRGQAGRAKRVQHEIEALNRPCL